MGHEYACFILEDINTFTTFAVFLFPSYFCLILGYFAAMKSSRAVPPGGLVRLFLPPLDARCIYFLTFHYMIRDKDDHELQVWATYANVDGDRKIFAANKHGSEFSVAVYFL